MTITQTDIQSLQQAIRQLSRLEREELAEWILNSSDFDFGVREAVAGYGLPHSRFMTVDEYLDLESGLVRYEYIAGQIFAMASPTNRHEMIVANLIGHLSSQLRATACRAFSSKAKVRLKIGNDDIFYMPDVLVACGPFTSEVLDQQFLTSPSLIVEVLSPSTEAIDRREKALNYRQLPSLEEFLLIAPRTMQVTVFRRHEQWQPQVLARPDEVFESRAVEVSIALADIYAGVR
jgi:Uma2 family endonuclease